MNSKYALPVVWCIAVVWFGFMWAAMWGPLNYENREQRRLERVMPAAELKDLAVKCLATGGEVRGRLVETGPNVGQVNVAYCEYNNERYGIVRIKGDIERKGDMVPLDDVE